MAKFIHEVYPPPRPSKPPQRREPSSDLGPVLTPEMIEGARGFRDMMDELVQMDEWEADAHIGHEINRGYVTYVKERGWEIVKDEKEQLGIYIPPWEEVDTHDLDLLCFKANRGLFVYRRKSE